MSRFSDLVKYPNARTLFAGASLAACLMPIARAAASADFRCETPVQTAVGGEALYCIDKGGAGLLGQASMTSTQTAEVVVRALPNLTCGLTGYDDLGNLVGYADVTAAQGSADTCFLYDSVCYEASPIAQVRLACWVDRD